MRTSDISPLDLEETLAAFRIVHSGKPSAWLQAESSAARSSRSAPGGLLPAPEFCLIVLRVLDPDNPVDGTSVLTRPLLQ